MQPQPAEGKTPPNVLPFGRASKSFDPIRDQAVSEPGPEIHDHTLVRRIGRGAYGEVWLARSALGTCRAIKIVYRKDFEDSRPFEREFAGIQKFEPISRSHPGLVNILHVGRREDYFYYVMELADDASAECGVRNAESGKPSAQPGVQNAPIEGPSRRPIQSSTPHSALRTPHSYAPRTLRDDLRQHGRLPAEQCVEIGLALTAALAHLHRHGLVHRDVKPSNIIFVQGAPKLADIGLVTEAGDSRSIVGTEGYLPPEGPGSPQADIFSLGKVIYEISTGQDRRQFPDLPPDLKKWPNHQAVLELNEIVLKACATASGQRYGGAEHIAADLQRLVAGRSVRRARQFERRWHQFRRAAALGAAAVAGLALTALVNRVRAPGNAALLYRPSTNDDANTFYKMGKTHFDVFTGTNFYEAERYFRAATNADPNFATAYGYLAATYFWSDENWNTDWTNLANAKEMAGKALELDKSLAEPHLALGWYHTMREWAWNDAEKEYRQALQLNPSSSFCHLSYAEFLRVVGRTDDALQEMDKALKLDEHSVIINYRLVSYLVDAGQFQQALKQADKVLAMSPAKAGVEEYPLCALGRYEEAIEAECRYRIVAGESRAEVEKDMAEVRMKIQAEGPNAFWRRELDWQRKRGNTYGQARAFAQLGRPDEALASLTRCLEDRDVGLTFGVCTDWTLNPLRTDPHFHEILKTMHLE